MRNSISAGPKEKPPARVFQQYPPIADMNRFDVNGWKWGRKENVRSSLQKSWKRTYRFKKESCLLATRLF
jgi:hypothetical protein